MPRRKSEEERPSTDLSDAYRTLNPNEFLNLARSKKGELVRLEIPVASVDRVLLFGFVNAVPEGFREINIIGNEEELRHFEIKFSNLMQYVKLKQV